MRDLKQVLLVSFCSTGWTVQYSQCSSSLACQAQQSVRFKQFSTEIFCFPRSKVVMDPVRDELLLTDDHEETDDDETDETDDVSSGWLHIQDELNIDISRRSWISS